MNGSNKKAAELIGDLAQFTGDVLRYRSLNPCVVYSPGVRYLAEKAEAYWLIDAIASCFIPGRRDYPDPRLKSLQFWRLDVNQNRTAMLTSRADSDERPYVTQQIEYTDFPLQRIDIWAGFDGKYWTLYLPSEH